MPGRGDGPASPTCTVPPTPAHAEINAATVEAATLLADAWGPALAKSYELGYQDGHRAGATEGRAEESRSWQMVMGVWREGLARRDKEQQRPCTTCGRCSNCVRVDWVRRHGGDYRGAAAAGASLARVARLDYGQSQDGETPALRGGAA